MQGDISAVKLKLWENAEQQWVVNCNRKPKLRTFISFENKLEAECYTKYCFSRQQRSLIAQFRLGILPLKIETGRF